MEREMTETEKKKEFLRSYLIAKSDVARLEEQLAELRMNKISPSVINDGMPHGSTSGDLSAYAAQVDDLERKIMAARYRRINRFQMVQEAIESMEDDQAKKILTLRYLRGMGWEAIAVVMGYTYRHTTKLHGIALKNFKMT